MVWDVINAKLSYLRTLILKPGAGRIHLAVRDWMKPKLRNFTSKQSQKRNGYLRRAGV